MTTTTITADTRARQRRTDREPVESTVAASLATSNAEDISRRAYELFLQRGAEHGHDVEDWLAAERELSTVRES